MQLLQTLWFDEDGAASAMSLLLIVTILALGAIVGLTTIRDQVVQELGDIGMALESLNQSYTTPTSTFVDPTPFPNVDPDGSPPSCLCLNVAAQPESP